MANDVSFYTRREILKAGASAFASAAVAPSLAELAQQGLPQGVNVAIEVEDKHGSIPTLDLSRFHGRYEHHPEVHELQHVTAEEVRDFYQDLVEQKVIPDVSPSDVFLDSLVSQISSNPHFLRTLKLIKAERTGSLIVMLYSHPESVSEGFGPQDYQLDLEFVGTQEGERIKPINVNYFMLLTPRYGHRPSIVSYELYVGANYETHALVLHDEEGSLKSTHLRPLDNKDNYLIANLDVFGRRAKVLKALQTQDLSVDVAKR